MKILTRCISILFIFISTVQQAQNVFQKTFGGTGRETGTGITQTFDLGYIMVGKVNEPEDTTLYREYLIKTNAAGDTLWTRKLGYFDEIGSVVLQNRDSTYTILGNTNSFDPGFRNLIIKTDKDGNIIMSTTLFGSDAYMIGSDIKTTIGQYSNYIITGYGLGDLGFGGPEGLEGVFLCRTDSAGIVMWDKLYTGGSSTALIGNSVIQCKEGGYVILFQNSDSTSIYLIEADPLGGIGRQMGYTGTNTVVPGSIEETADGGYIITGYTNNSGAGFMDVFLMKTDDGGNISWAKTYGGILDDRGLKVKQLNDKGYVICGNTFNASGTSDAYLMKTDSLGNLLWAKAYGGANADYGYSFEQTSDHGFAIVGSTKSFGSGGNDLYFIKTDSTGYSGCNEYAITPATNTASFSAYITTFFAYPYSYLFSNPFTLEATPTTTTQTNMCYLAGVDETAADENNLLLYPNPASNQITLELSEATTQTTILQIKNTLGQILKTAPLTKGNKQQQIDISNLAPGFYFVQMQSGNRMISKKFIKQ